MALNKCKGNMYEFVTHTWNTVKGKCFHDCSYCNMKRFGNLNPIHFDEKELKTDLGAGNFIFVGSSNDMWADRIPDEWIRKTLEHCALYPFNIYYFQTKNPKNIRRSLFQNSIVCVTLETNRHYSKIMGNCPTPEQRVKQMKLIRYPLHITIDPIIDFDLPVFVKMLKKCKPAQINIGADSGGNHLPEPSWTKIEKLINELIKFTYVKQKKNIARIRKK